MIMAWTIKDRKEKYAEMFKTIAGTFKELWDRSTEYRCSIFFHAPCGKYGLHLEAWYSISAIDWHERRNFSEWDSQH
jgi:hypothetical protein